MSNIKHLPDILRVCSVLPALVVMPAVAGDNIVTGDTPLSYQDVKISHTTAGTDNALGVDAQGKATIDFNGDITNIAVNAEGNPKYSAAVYNRDSKGTVLNFNTDKTILSATGSSNYVLGVRVNGNGSGVNLNGETEINMSSNSTKQLRAIDVTDGGYVSLNDNTVLNLTGGKDTGEVIGILSSGAKSVDLAQGKDLEINASGAHEVYGLYAQYGGTINMAQDTEVDIHSTATGGDAYGVVSGYYLATGTIDSKGEIDIDVSGDNAYGLKNFGGSSTHIADLDIVATAQQIARGIWVTDDDLDEGKIETTDVVIGSEGSKTEIIAKGGDTKNTAGIWAEKLEKDVGLTILGDVDIKSDGYGVLATGGAVANIGTEYAGDIKIASTDAETLFVFDGGTLNVGGADTNSVEISSVDNNAIYVGKKNSVVNINGKNISISTNTDGWGAVHVANKTEDSDYADAATLNITGDNIKITAPETGVEEGIAITAMSQGVINVDGNATIRAQNAIVARGGAKVNVNTSGENTVKMVGDINFNYDKDTSGTSIDAFIDVTLAGADSVWTGNTVVTYDDKPETEKLAVSNAKLTMKDGAVWNATKITDSKEDVKGRYYTALNDLIINGGTVNIADIERGITIDRIVANDATFTGGMLNVNESIDIESGETLFNGNVTGAEGATLTLAKDATMDIGSFLVNVDTANINGTVIASAVSDRSHGRLWSENLTFGEEAVLKLNIGSVGTYDIFGDGKKYDVDILVGDTYIATETDRGIVIEIKSVADIAEDAGLTVETAGTVANLANSVDRNLQKLSLLAQQALNSGNSALVEKEAAKLAPEDENMTRSVAMSAQSQALSLASGRMMGGMGRAGGDKSQTNGFWAQGLFNKTKYADQFHGYSRGFAVGADTTIDRKYTIGAGLTHTNSDVHSGSRHTDISTTTLFAYGQYKPTDWFLNGTLVYAMSEYDENIDPFGVQINSLYNANSFGAQAMTGYALKSGLTPQVGIRYLHIEQDEYNNGVNRMNAMDYEYLSGVAGFAYSFNINNARSALQLKPELRAMLTYDLVQDNSVATVVMNNINSSYIVDGENLSRVGGEFGVGLTATYNGVDVSVMYDITLHEDYTSQTGMIKFRGQF